jgi:hypothetical protein
MGSTIAHWRGEAAVGPDDTPRDWRYLGSIERERLGQLTPREDWWRLPTGLEKTCPILHVGSTLGVVPFVDATYVLVIRQFRHTSSSSAA